MPVKLTTGNRPWGLAIDNTYVYWVRAVQLRDRAASTRTVRTPIALATGSSNAFGTHQLATDGADVYWSNLGDIMKCAVNGLQQRADEGPTEPPETRPTRSGSMRTASTGINKRPSTNRRRTAARPRRSTTQPFSDTVENFVVDNGFRDRDAERRGAWLKVPTGGGAPVVARRPDVGIDARAHHLQTVRALLHAVSTIPG